MGLFKKLFKKKNTGPKQNKMFGELPFDTFKELLIHYYMQDWALEDGNSYFEPQDSLLGEMFDNAIRIKFLKQENSRFDGQYDDEVLKQIAKYRYDKDKNDFGKLDIEKDGENTVQGLGEAPGDND
jgi:hypothetical protein